MLEVIFVRAILGILFVTGLPLLSFNKVFLKCNQITYHHPSKWLGKDLMVMVMGQVFPVRILEFLLISYRIHLSNLPFH